MWDRTSEFGLVLLFQQAWRLCNCKNECKYLNMTSQGLTKTLQKIVCLTTRGQPHRLILGRFKKHITGDKLFKK